jgi:hypothetical protein
MTSALASMDLCEQVTALFLDDAPHEDAIGATAVEIPFYHHVSLSQSHYALSEYMVFRKDVVFQVVSDLGDPCIGTPPESLDAAPRGLRDSRRCKQSLADPTDGAPLGPLASRC